MLLTLILIVAGLVGFAIFFKSIDFFDKIWTTWQHYSFFRYWCFVTSATYWL